VLVLLQRLQEPQQQQQQQQQLQQQQQQLHDRTSIPNKAIGTSPASNDSSTTSSCSKKKKKTGTASASSAPSSSCSSFERKVPVSSLLAQLPPAWRVHADLETVRAAQQQQDQPSDPDAPTWGAECRAVEAFLPTPQHVELWRVAKVWIEATTPPLPPHRGAPLSLTFEPAHNLGPAKPVQEDHRPLGIICAVLVVLLEAGLRRLFCQANPQRQGRDDHARPGAYYVTLDGHGQRDRHELLLQPYLVEAEPCGLDPCEYTPNPANSVKKNRLLDRLGASRTSFLTDLFVSPYGPNLRAALSHGSWNARFADDVRRLASVRLSNASNSDAREGCGSFGDVSDDAALPTSTIQSDEEALASMEALLSALYCCSLASDEQEGDAEENHQAMYLSQCSFTANVLSSLRTILHEHYTITRILQTRQFESTQDRLRGVFGFHDDATRTGQLEHMIRHLRPLELDSQATDWTLDLLYQEYGTNRALGPAVATRALANDVADFMTRFQALLEPASNDVADDTAISSRQRKTRLRLLACANDLSHFVSFACRVAMSSLEDTLLSSQMKTRQPSDPSSENFHHEHNQLARLSDQEKVKLVERTRMVVSTVSTFMTANTDRAFKAIEEYSRSKLIKKFITYLD
jgi:hypothetical protein